MFNTLKHASTRAALLAATLFATAAAAFAQMPTDAQKAAIRSSCRADYQANCASVPPGGEASLQCLQSHMSSLSAACQGVVRAIEPAAAPRTEAPPKSEPAKSEPAKTEAAPAATEAPKAAAGTAAPKAAAATNPSSAQVAAIKTACRADYPKVCASVPPGGAPALACLEKNKARVSASCARAVTAAAGGGAAATAPAGGAPATAAPTAAAPAAAPTVIVLRPLLLREELFIARSACGGDITTLCAGVAPGGGRIAQCLATNAASLSPACKGVLAPFAAR
jgi:hypothetical protein